jgi:DNA-directed RNA polymerase specialized sigma24 family protein
VRTFTPNEYRPGGGIIRVKRACNGCGELIGDVTDQEINACIDGRPLTDVRGECPWCATKAALAAILVEQDDFEADLAYLRSYSAALIEHALPLLPAPAADSVHQQLIEDTPPRTLAEVMSIMSPRARRELIRTVM